MNTYYITARISGTAEYTVEAETEEDAITEVEYGNADLDSYEIEVAEDCEVNDVEYGDVERYGKLGVTFVTRGKVEEQTIVDALYSLLQQFDGKTTEYKDSELELIGFSVDHIDEV